MERSNLARLNADGSVDAGWNPAPNGPIKALAIAGDGSIYAGGGFLSIGGQSRYRVARLSGSTGSPDPDWNPLANAEVLALALDGLGSVYVGGGFTSIGGQSRSNLAKLSAGDSGAADPAWIANANQVVHALALDGGFLYAGGLFTAIGSQPAGFLVRLVASSAAVDTAWSPNVGGPSFTFGQVMALAPDGSGSLYVGGTFNSVGGQSRTNVARVSTSVPGSVDASWNPAPSGPLFSGSVRAFRLAGGSLYVGGDFATIGGESRSGLARLSTTGTGTADPAWNPSPNSLVNALALDPGGRLHVGGYFQSIGGQSRGGLAVLDTVTGAADAGWPVLVSPGPGVVRAVARDASGRTIIGGQFIAMGDRSTLRANLARFNADGSLDAAWDPGCNGGVYSLAVDSMGDVFAGGVFTRIGGRARSNIAKLSGSGSGAADPTWNPGANVTAPYTGVGSLVLDGAGALFAGGYFDSIGGLPRNNLAKLAATGAGLVDSAWNHSINGFGFVSALALEGTSLYVGGLYSSIGGQPRSNIAKVSTSGAGAVDPDWKPNSASGVWSLALDGRGHVFAVGGFLAGGRLRSPAKLSTAGAGSVDEAWSPSIGAAHLALDPFGNLYVGGPDTLARVSAYGTGPSDASWRPAVTGSVSALVADSGGVHVGGAFTAIAGQSRAGYAAFGPPGLPGAPLIGPATAGNRQVGIEFTPPPDGGAPITSYTATCNPGGITQSGSGTPIVVTGLSNGTTYTCTVTATNGVGTGPASAPSNSATPAPVLPGPPVIGVATASGAQASVTFTAPASDGGSPITLYTATSTPGGISASAPASPIVVTGLANRTAYTFTVTATNAVGTGPASAASNSVTPIAPSPPGAPAITLASPANGQATIHFRAPSDDGLSPITGYTVTCNPGGIAVSGAASPITVTGLVNETTYSCVATATNAIGTGPASAPATVRPTANPGPQMSLSPAAVDFGGQSMGTTSWPVTVTVSNPGAGALTIGSVFVSGAQFAQAHNCTVVPPGGSCAVNVTFTPAPESSSTADASGVLTVTGDLSATVPLAGVGERSLVSHYYRSILRRAPDPGGKAYWQNEAARVSALGANVNEVWFALAGTFYTSPEYLAQNRDNTGFVTDLYNTFFNRAPDSGGLAYWVGQLDSGMPREVLLAQFMFSPEFAAFTTAIFGAPAARAEVDMVMDFYRGILGRLPDDGGFAYWVQRFRTAQCQAGAAIVSEVEAISSAFTLSGEYSSRGRDNTRYVGDLYNAFLRRGGDLAGVQFWISQLDSVARSREQVRLEFRNSFEFQARVRAIIQQGCL